MKNPLIFGPAGNLAFEILKKIALESTDPLSIHKLLKDMKDPYQIRIAMVGASRIGKSSIIASMYKTLDSELAQKGVNFRAAGSSSDIMSEKKSALQDLATEDSRSVTSIFAIAGDNERSEYRFLVDLNPSANNGNDIEVVFIDMPGGLYHDGNTDYSAPAKDIHDSTMSIVAIHTPALIKGNKHHRKINKPDNIYEAFKTASPEPGSIILLCAVRSERWVNSDKVYRRRVG